MAPELPDDFKEFLRLLTSHQVKYLLIGGFAIGYHGYPRATNDIDIWVEVDEENATRLVAVIKEFGFAMPQLTKDLFLQSDEITRMGVPPMRIEVLTSISDVEFEKCYASRSKTILMV